MVLIPKREQVEKAQIKVRGGEPIPVPEAPSWADLNMQSKMLVNLRHDAYRLEAEIKTARAAWTMEHQEIIDRAKTIRDMANNAEWELRQLAVNAYVSFKDEDIHKAKHPAPGVDVAVSHKAVYDRDAARAWAYAHDVCMSFDEKAFEKLARSNPKLFDFVSWEEEPMARLASNLRECLIEAEAAVIRQERGISDDTGISGPALAVPPGRTAPRAPRVKSRKGDT